MFPAKEDTGGLLVPLVSFTGRDPCIVWRIHASRLLR